ncbi:RNA polymerase subunit sigma-70 [Nocardia aurantia]|uniref:ECF RNA polymerase sigma factor SigG n=1 Tax=Nocardia aurantia TaxID=2585199 RepID=A0A7K0DI26_9NOCA|nr:RNA polymerase subunit sigma-70 [Nocardia aurantia]MQY25307.1 ECF RNA polymerase sigma factor SigG [Nocardia aurantia]
MSASTGAAATEPGALEAARIPLTGYCYRMLGSAADAEDAVQETLLRAYLRLDTFDPARSRLSTWLHAIATNICLDLLRGRTRRMLTWDGPVAGGFDPGSALPPDRWIEPMPDAALIATRDPAEVVAQRESVRLAFVAALQHLPPRQRAVLVLREVLAFTASETADMLGVSAAAVNSALQRARATLAAARTTPAEAPDPADRADRDLIRRYVTAFEAHDVAALAALLCEDAESGMPPLAWRLTGRETIVAVFAAADACVGDRLIEVAMNGSIGFGQYRLDGAGVPRPFALLAITTRGGAIAEQVTFLGTADRFAEFGLPAVPAPRG